MRKIFYLPIITAVILTAASANAFANSGIIGEPSFSDNADSTDAPMTWVLESKVTKFKGEKRHYTNVNTIQVPGSSGKLSEGTRALGEYYGRMMRDSLQLGKSGFHTLQTYYAMELNEHRKRIQAGTDSYPESSEDKFDVSTLKWKKSMFGLEVGLHETNVVPLGYVSDYTAIAEGLTLDLSLIFGKFFVKPSLVMAAGKLRPDSIYNGGGAAGFEGVIGALLWFVSQNKYSLSGANKHVPYHVTRMDVGYYAYDKNGVCIYPFVGFGTDCWNFTEGNMPHPIRGYIVCEGVGVSYEPHKTVYMGKGSPHYISCPIHARLYTDQIFNMATGGFSPSLSFSVGFALHYHQIKEKL